MNIVSSTAAREAKNREAFPAAALGCLAALFALAITPITACAAPVYGSAFVGGSWMVGSQSYFSVSILGYSTIGWCLNPGAAEPLPGWYSFSANRTVERSGQPSVWLEGSLEPVSYDALRGVSSTGAVTLRSGTDDAWWDLTVPSGCTLIVDGSAFASGSSVRVRPGQSARIESASPVQVGTVVLSGTAHASITVTTRYSGIVITPPGAWDGHSYANGLPAGYQRVGVGPISIEDSESVSTPIAEAVDLSADVRYFVDGEDEPCWSESAPIGATFVPSEAAFRAGSKPSCTPGLDAWYFDEAYALPYAPFVLKKGTDLYGQNWCTLRFAPAEPSGFQHETPAVDEQSPTASSVSLASLLPSPIVDTWGTTIGLPAPSERLLYFHDGSRWRTLRRPEEGWHRTPSASDPSILSTKLLRDTVLYDFWTVSTFDGVLGW